MADVEWLVYHHTNEGPSRPKASNIAIYQTGPNAHLPFPSIAYHLYVEEDGEIVLAHDLHVLCWSQGEGSTTGKFGVGSNNWKGISCCFSGENPTPQQIAAMQRIGNAIDEVIGRPLQRRGHGQVSVNDSGVALTKCPGPLAPIWLPQVQS